MHSLPVKIQLRTRTRHKEESGKREIIHPRRPRGSRVGRKGGTKVFKYGRKSPWVPTLTELFPKIQADAGSWLGTKNALYYCAQSANTSQWVLFVCSYMTAIVSITVCLAHAPKKCTQSGNFQFWYKIHIWSNSLACQMQANSSGAEFLSTQYPSSWNTKRIILFSCLFTSFTKREIRHFHG